MVKVALVGAAGGIGQPLSLLLKLNVAVTELRLCDVVPSVKGVAADVSHIDTPAKVSFFVGDERFNGLDGADIVVIPAGVPRKPGMTRDDLFNINAGIVKEVADACADRCPNAFFGIISNPVNSTVPIFAEAFKKKKGSAPFERIFGVSTLDVLRANTFVAEKKGLDPTKLNVTVIGGHAGKTIIPLLSQTGLTFTEDEIKALTVRIQEGGTEVVEAKAGAGSATLSMAQAAIVFTNHLITALKGGESTFCAYVYDQSREAAGVTYFAQPVVVGPQGIKEKKGTGALSAFEQAALDAALPELAGSIKNGVQFVATK